MWSNIVTLLGALCVLAAIFGLAGGWWALLVLGGLLLVAGYRNWTAPAAVPARRLASVDRSEVAA